MKFQGINRCQFCMLATCRIGFRIDNESFVSRMIKGPLGCKKGCLQATSLLSGRTFKRQVSSKRGQIICLSKGPFSETPFVLDRVSPPTSSRSAFCSQTKNVCIRFGTHAANLKQPSTPAPYMSEIGAICPFGILFPQFCCIFP